MKKALLQTLVYTATLVPVFAITKAGSGTELTDPASWAGGIAPGTGDPAVWDSTSNTGAQNIGGDVTWNTMVFGLTGNVLGGDLTLGGPGKITLSLNANGLVIDGAFANGQAVNIGNDLILSSDAGGIVGVGATTNRVQISSGPTAATTLTFGNITANGGGLANDANVMFRGNTSFTTVNGTLTIDGQLYKGDTGTLTLNGSNSIGWIFANNGTLLAGNNAAFGTGTIFFGAGGGTPTIASATSAARSFTNALDFSTGATFGQISGGTGTLSFSGNVNLGTAARTITTNVDTTFSGVVSGTVATPLTTNSITKAGAATLTLSNANTYNGRTEITAGTVAAGTNTSLGTGTLRLGGGTIASTNSTARTFANFVDLAASSTIGAAGTGDLNFDGTLALGGGVKTMTVHNVATFNGDVTGTGTNVFTKAGTGTLVISGATLSTVRPMEVAAGTLTLDDNAVFQFQITTNGLSNGLNTLAGTENLHGVGTLLLNGDFSFNLTGASTTAGDSWNIVDVGTLSENFGATFTVLGFTANPDNVTWSNGIYRFSELTGTLTVVPEPGAALMGGLGLLGLLRRRRN